MDLNSSNSVGYDEKSTLFITNILTHLINLRRIVSENIKKIVINQMIDTER